MSALSMTVAVALVAGVLVMTVGIALRSIQYWRTPAPLKIPTMPAPTSRAGVAWRMFKEVVLFESLFKASLWTWLFGWLFHAGALVVVLVHLRYFTDPVWGWVVSIQGWSTHAGLAMLFGLVGLQLRRILVDRVRYISSPSDHLMLGLLFVIAISGLCLANVARTDVVAVTMFTLGLRAGSVNPLPTDLLLVVHLLSVAVLLLIFPFSKLMHAPGVFFSPTLNQVDDSRERRYSAHAPRSSVGRTRRG